MPLKYQYISTVLKYFDGRDIWRILSEFENFWNHAINFRGNKIKGADRNCPYCMFLYYAHSLQINLIYKNTFHVLDAPFDVI